MTASSGFGPNSANAMPYASHASRAVGNERARPAKVRESLRTRSIARCSLPESMRFSSELPPPTPRRWSAPRGPAPRPDRFPRSLPSRPPFFFFLALPWGGMAAAARVPNARCRERGRRRCAPTFPHKRKIARSRPYGNRVLPVTEAERPISVSRCTSSARVRHGDPPARAEHGRQVGGGDRPHAASAGLRKPSGRRRGTAPLPCVPHRDAHDTRKNTPIPSSLRPLPRARPPQRKHRSDARFRPSIRTGGAGSRSATLAFGAGAALGSAYTGTSLAHPRR